MYCNICKLLSYQTYSLRRCDLFYAFCGLYFLRETAVHHRWVTVLSVTSEWSSSTTSWFSQWVSESLHWAAFQFFMSSLNILTQRYQLRKSLKTPAPLSCAEWCKHKKVTNLNISLVCLNYSLLYIRLYSRKDHFYLIHGCIIRNRRLLNVIFVWCTLQEMC